MSDKEGPRKSNGRPQSYGSTCKAICFSWDNSHSTIARNFSAALNDAFSIDSNVDRNLKGLVQSVEQKYVSDLYPFEVLRKSLHSKVLTSVRKQAVDSQNQELEALEARLRDTEERLRQQQSRKSSHTAKISAIKSSHPRQPLGPTFSDQVDDRANDSATRSLAAQPRRTQPSTSRASSYQMPPMPGALPPTPGVTSSQDYYK